MFNDEFSLIDETTDVFLRDLYDHSVQVIDTIESFRDTASGLIDLYMSSISHRMNEVMQVLTITASLFIPLTFIAGIYGMNFLSATDKRPLVAGCIHRTSQTRAPDQQGAA